jgi:hypothetical protein
MFEQLPFYNGRLLTYKQFFFYMVFLLIFVLFLVTLITDIALNLALWYHKTNKSMFIEVDEEEDHMTKSQRKASMQQKVEDKYFVEESKDQKDRKTIQPDLTQSKEWLEMEEVKEKQEIDNLNEDVSYSFFTCRTRILMARMSR